MKRSDARRLTRAWAELFPEFAVWRPLRLLRRIGPVVQRIVLEPSGSADRYYPTAHVHPLTRDFPVVSLGMAWRVRLGAGRRARYGSMRVRTQVERRTVNWTELTEARGFAVGDLLRLSAAAFDSHVVAVSRFRLSVAWPWYEVDEHARNRWDGTIGFPRDSDHHSWANTPWRLEPAPEELREGSQCFVGIVPVEVRVMGVGRYDPPADFGLLPRPEYALDVCPVDLLDDEEAGYVLYLDGVEPIEIEVLERAGRSG